MLYEYDIRGWLKSINKDYLNSGGNNAHFGMELNYDYGFTSNYYNGNIGGVRWKGWNDPLPRAYGYSYDKVNRLVSASFLQQNSGAGTWGKKCNEFFHRLD